MLEGAAEAEQNMTEEGSAQLRESFLPSGFLALKGRWQPCF